MTTNKVQQRYRIDTKYIDLISTIENERKTANKSAALEYILQEYIELKNKQDTTNNEKIIEDTSKLLKAVNQSSKDIKTIIEFANTVAYREMFEENISSNSEQTNWLKEAKEEVSNQIQYQRTKSLSEH